MLKLVFGLALGVAAFGTFTPKAHAADPGFCERLRPRQAVAQYNRNRSIPGCFRGANRRWNADFDGHYGWCLRASYVAARSEGAYRSDGLRGCMIRAGY